MTEKRLIQRADKVAFAKIADTYYRMEGFTSLATNKNPKEYTRQYVDQIFETTDVVGISASMDFGFDQYTGDPVHDYIVDIIDNEKIGTDAGIEIMAVDFSKPGENEGEFHAKKREYSIIPNTEGGSMDAYTYEGTFKVKAAPEDVIVTSSDEWKTATIKTDPQTP